MSSTHGALILQHIRRLAAPFDPGLQSDTQLLQQFITKRDEAAFAALVERHGSMVQVVCQSVLRHRQDAEDVFQAAFLVLARKAHTVRRHEALSSWLHGVAYRLSLKARSRQRLPVPLPPPGGQDEVIDSTASSPPEDLVQRDRCTILHEELSRLDDKYRTPLLLCYWEGKTRSEAAEQLGMTPDAFKKYLERARHLLGSRLARRGLASAAILASLLPVEGVHAALPGILVKTTAQAAVAYAAGSAVGVSGAALALAKGAMQSMNLIQWAKTSVMILLLTGLVAGVGVAGFKLLPGDAVHRPGNPFGVGVKAPAQAGKPKSDEDRIVGVWRVRSGIANGQEVPLEVKALMRWSFARDGTAIMSVAEKEKRGTYALVGAGKIDLVDPDDKTGRSPAIYRFEGNDLLTLCIGEGGNKKRPSEFSGAAKSEQLLLVLQRTKPGEEKPTKDDLAKLGGADKLREAAARAVSVNNLKQIGLAFHSYHDVVKELPAHAIYSKDGKTPLLSWRVALLPYLDEVELYRQFKLDEPWDSAHNKKLIARMPNVYTAGKAKKGETHYQVVTGPGTLFEGPRAMKFQQVTDGLSNTLLALEAADPVLWTKPSDLALPKAQGKLPLVGTLFPGGFHGLRGDGSVHFMPSTIAPATFRALVTPAAND